MQITPILAAFALIAPALAGQSPREMNHAQMARTFGNDGLSSEKCYGSPVAPWKKGCFPGWFIGSECGPTKGHQPKKWDGGDSNQCGHSHAKNWSCCKPHAPHKGTHGPHKSHGHGSAHPKPSCSGKPGHSQPGHSKPTHSHSYPHHSHKPTSTSSAPVTQPTGTGPVCDGEYEQTFSNYTTVALTGVYQGQIVGAATIDNEHYAGYGLVDTVDQCMDACDDVKDCAFINVYQEFNSTIKDSYGAGKLTCALFTACSGTDQATNYGGQDDPTYVVNSTGYCKSGKCAPVPARRSVEDEDEDDFEDEE